MKVDILIVDDDVAFAQSLQEELQQLGYVAVTAANGRDALRMAGDRPPRLILLDLDMPIMNGWQFLERRRVDRKLAAIPVVVVSAIPRAARGGQRDDVAATLEKPLDPQQLVASLDLLLPADPAHGGETPGPPSPSCWRTTVTRWFARATGKRPRSICNPANARIASSSTCGCRSSTAGGSRTASSSTAITAPSPSS
jgi:CheY-like chemotaxis protein